MAKHVYMVMTNAAEGREDEFNEWYDQQHLGDILRLPGFVSARRFRLSQTDPAQAAPQKYLAIYEIETDDIASVNQTMLAAAGTDALPLSPSLDLRSLQAYYFEELP